MEISLKEFVAETIKEIVEGITEAQKNMLEQYKNENDPNIAIATDRKQNIEFDISVTTSRTGETSGGGGISIKVIDFGLKGSEKQEYSAVNKIKFSVGMYVAEVNNFPKVSRSSNQSKPSNNYTT